MRLVRSECNSAAQPVGCCFPYVGIWMLAQHGAHLTEPFVEAPVGKALRHVLDQRRWGLGCRLIVTFPPISLHCQTLALAARLAKPRLHVTLRSRCLNSASSDPTRSTRTHIECRGPPARS